MKIFLKPIQFQNLKDEICVLIDGNKKIVDLTEEVKKQKSDIGGNLDFMFRGKKLVNEKNLEEQGVKEGAKLMMYQATESKSSSEEVSAKNKESAKKSLIEMGFKIDIVESVVKTIPNVDNLSSDSIIEKSLVFLKNMTKETISEYSIEVNGENSLLQIDEEKIASVFTFGDGIQGQLGVGKYIKSDFPMRVNSLRSIKIKSIACGVSHTTSLTINGHGNQSIIYNL